MTKNNALAIAILALALSTQPVSAATNSNLTTDEEVSQRYVVAEAAQFRQLSAAALDHTDIL